jgi:hypothetical protein
MNDSSNGKVVNNKLYDFLKFVALILLPGLGTLYFALAGTWGLPNANEVVATVTAVDTFLGLVVQFLANRYNNSDAKYDGAIVVTENAIGKKTYSLEFDGDPETLDKRDEIVFKIKGSTAG